MSTRTHWLRPNKRITACGRNAFQSDIFEGSAAEYLGVSNFCVKCERSAQKEQQPRPRSCKHCGSQAINPGFRERPQGIDLDLCDVCFWRVRAQPEPRPIAEAPKLECILAYVPTSSEPHLEGRWLLMVATEDKEKIDGFTVLGANPAADRWFTCSILQPTHFLPLPPAPEVRK